MASVFLFVFLVLLYLLLLNSAEEELQYTKKCPPFRCGSLGDIHFPFANTTTPECGVFTVDCQFPNSTIQLEDDGRSYEVKSISQDNTIFINDKELGEDFKSNRCESLTNLTFPNSSFISFEIATPNQTFFKCKDTLDILAPKIFTKKSCNNHNIYYSNSSDSFPSSFSGCSIIQLPKNLSLLHGQLPDDDNLFGLLSGEFELGARVSDECYKCYSRGGQCKAGDNEKFYCDGAVLEKGIDLGVTQ
jgi:hypothetical protein